MPNCKSNQNQTVLSFLKQSDENRERETEYHEAICEDLDAGVAEGSGGELEGTQVAGEDLGGHGHDVVDHVDDDGGSGQVEEELELDPRGGAYTAPERDAGVGEDGFKVGVRVVLGGERLIRRRWKVAMGQQWLANTVVNRNRTHIKA